MLDPFSALGLAGNVVQFVDFTSKLISDGRKIYRDGAATEVVDLQLITEDLVNLNEKLSTSPLASNGVQRNQDPEDRDLKVLVDRSNAVGKELLLVLQDLQAAPQQRFESFRQAFRTVRKKGDINAIQNRLDRLRDQLSIHLIAALGDQHSNVFQTMKHLESENRRHEMNMAGRLFDLKSEILKSVNDQQQKAKLTVKQEGYAFPTVGLNAVDLSNISAKINLLVDEGAKMRVEQKLLSSLRFKSIDARMSKVSDAHARTFEWIFEDKIAFMSDGLHGRSRPQVTFKEWLRSGDGSFWISGKPGSGKSTLMKFLAAHPSTYEALSMWAGEKRLLTASYYFWNAGSHLQKSQDGLLQTILYDIFRRFPQLLPSVLPSRWQACSTSWSEPEPWTRPELLQAFRRLVTQNMTSRICLFIDGLDEYAGDHSEIVGLMEEIISCPDIKICLSSRSWNIFEDAFGSRPSKKLLLQDLTYGDIKRYTEDKLESNHHFKNLKNRDSRCQGIVLEIVERAQGVFLWVYLVVRDLLQGLTNSDRLIDLERRLRRLPVDLEKYFKHILDTAEDFYHAQTAQAFDLCLKASEPPLLMAFAVMDNDLDPETVRNHPPSDVESFIVDQYECMIRRLNARCKGLLEVSGDPWRDPFFCKFECQVDFLHRTVRDFLETTSMQEWLASRIPNTFNSYSELSKAYLGTLKIQLAISKNLPSSQELLDHCLCYTHKAKLSADVDPLGIFDEVVGLLHCFCDDDSACGINSAILVKKGIYTQIQRQIEINPNWVRDATKQLGCSPLAYALLEKRLVKPPHVPGYHLWSTDLVRIFLEQGEDPNEKHNYLSGSSAWAQFLEFLWAKRGDMSSEDQKAVWYRITRTLIANGADPKLTLLLQGEQRTVLEIVAEVFESRLGEKQLALANNTKTRLEIGKDVCSKKDRNRVVAWFRRSKIRKPG